MHSLSTLLSLALLVCPSLPLPNAAKTTWAPSAHGNHQYDTYVTGPVLALNFPDPCIISVKGTWWAFATNGNDVYIQVATSKDFNTWEYLNGTDALPSPPAWVKEPSSNVWAPDVNQLADGSFVMYFSASTIAGNGSHCVGAATSKNVEGPYVALDEPLACPLSQGGAIDSSGFKDWSIKGSGWGYGSGQDEDGSGDCWNDAEWWGGGKGGQNYMLYKIDGNSMGHGGACGNAVPPIVPTPIMIQAVKADGVTPQGSPVQILDNNGVSDMGIVEAPSLVKTASGEYVLFFSSGCYSTTNYQVDYATASHVLGPYTRQPSLFVTGDVIDNGRSLSGPGGPDVYWDAHHMVFHGNYPSSSTRAMYTALIDILGTKVVA